MVQQRGCLHVARTGNIAVLSEFLYNILFITLKTAMVNLPEWKSIHTKNVSISILNFSTPHHHPTNYVRDFLNDKRIQTCTLINTTINSYRIIVHSYQSTLPAIPLSTYFFNVAFWLQLSMRQLVMVLLCIVAYFHLQQNGSECHEPQGHHTKCPAQSGCKTDQNYEPGKLIITDPVAGKTSKGYLTYHIFIQHLQTYFF